MEGKPIRHNTFVKIENYEPLLFEFNSETHEILEPELLKPLTDHDIEKQYLL